MSFFAAGGGIAVIAGLGLRYIESRCEMSDIDAAPGSMEPQPVVGRADLPVRESIVQDADASALGLSPEAIGSASPATTTPAGDSTDSDPNAGAETAANPSSQQSADSGASTSDGDAGEQAAEEPKDSGMPSQSGSTVDPAQDVALVEVGGCAPPVIAGNAVGPVDSAETATSPEDALTAVVAVTAAAFSVDMLDKFETRKYPDGTIMRTIGALPETSPVSYPAPTAPAADTPHGLLNAIEEYFTTALRSSRTDGHKLIAQLRALLPQD